MKDSDRQLLWTYVYTFGGIKLVASIVTLYYFWSMTALVAILVLSIPWVLGGIWYIYHLSNKGVRHWKVRKLRRRLVWEEWNVDDDRGDPVTHSSPDGNTRDSR